MNRTFKNTCALLAVTALTALSIFGTVHATALLAGIGATNSGGITAAASGSIGGADEETSQATQTCPRTGCTASYCHATQGGQPGASSNGSGGSGWGSNRTWQ